MILGIILFVGLGVQLENYNGPVVEDLPMTDISLEQQQEVWKELEAID